MTELKTLKELKGYALVKDGKAKFMPEGFINRDELKQEAIKHIKVGIKEITEDLMNRRSPMKNMERQAQINWAIYFFNITKEDLK